MQTATGSDLSSISAEIASLTSSQSTTTATTTTTSTKTGSTGAAPIQTGAVAMGALLGGAALLANL
jgi:chemotaxis response regulator CheB